MSTPVPYLMSEKHFRLYEPWLRRIIDAWPQAISFTPEPPVASTETLASRIRICIKALRENLRHQPTEAGWDLGDFPVLKFLQICDEICTSLSARPGKVTCGPEDVLSKIARYRCDRAVEAATIEQSIPRINLVDPALDLVQAVIVLHHYQLLIEPSVIKTGFDVVAFITEKHYDVACEKVGDTYTLL